MRGNQALLLGQLVALTSVVWTLWPVRLACCLALLASILLRMVFGFEMLWDEQKNRESKLSREEEHWTAITRETPITVEILKQARAFA
jgi:hypothetical protein